MYYLQNNVEIVKGKKNSCIYNLNTKKMYNLTPDYVAYVEGIVHRKCSPNEVPEELLDYLTSEGILVTEAQLVDSLPHFNYSGHVDFAWIEITQNCNLLCRHCYEGSSRSIQLPNMPLSDFKKVIDSLVSIGVNRIQLVGGEPLIHPDITEMIKYVSNKFSFVEIFTNGTLITDELLEIINDSGISLAFSVYSQEAALHDRVTRTKGSYLSTSHAIKKAVSKGIKVRVASVEMTDIPKFEFSDKRVEHRTDFPRLTGRADLSLYSDEMLQRKLITKKTFIKPLDPEQYLKNKVMHNCFGELLYIDYVLNVFPCAMERRVSYGNLNAKPLSEMMRTEIATMNKDKIEGCRDCEYRYACYDCRPDCNHASIACKPWYCTYDQDTGQWIEPEEFIEALRSAVK